MIKKSVAERIEQVQSPVIPIVGDWVKAYPGTLSLGQGVVFYPPPKPISSSIQSFLEDPLNHHYQSVQGIDALLEAIQKKLFDENGMKVDAGGQIMVTAGSNMAFMQAILAIANPGDEVILPKPYYFNHEMALRMLGISTRFIEPDDAMLPTLDRVKEATHDRTRAVVTVSPNNPSGTVYPASLLSDINQFCREKNIYHISDEAYEYFHYDGSNHFSPGSLPLSSDHTLSLYSLSKAYGFASWRIGYMVTPPHLMPSMRKIQDTNLICAPVVSQYAATQALQIGRSYCTGHLSTMDRVRRHLIDALTPLAPWLRITPAKGAFYLLIRLECRQHPLEVVRWLIEKHRVAAIPGNAFGLENSCYLRIAYGSLETSTAHEAIHRLIAGLTELQKAS